NREDLYDPVVNARAALDLYNDDRRRGGSGYGAWKLANKRFHQQYLPLARSAYTGNGGAEVGAPTGDPFGMYQQEEPEPEPTPSSTPLETSQSITQSVKAAIPQKATQQPTSPSSITNKYLDEADKLSQERTQPKPETYDTPLTPDEETKFQTWKAQV